MRRCLLILSLGWLFAYPQSVRADFPGQVLSDNPSAFWILNDASTTAADSSGHGFNGTYGPGVAQQGIAGPSWVPGSGLVANFTGGNISFPGPLNLSTGLTIEAWINPTLSSLQNTTRIVASSGGVSGYGFGTTAGGELIYTSFGVQDYETTTLTLLPNQWYYVGVVLDASNNANFYVNGVLVQTVAGTSPPNFTLGNFTIGNQSPGPLHIDEPFLGGLAGISVYNSALSAAQILAQYNAAIVPEPSSLMLMGVAALGAGFILRRRRSMRANILRAAARLRLVALVPFLIAAGALVTQPSRASAAFTFTLTQVGNDVVVFGSGTLDLTSLTLLDPLFPNQGVLIEPSSAVLAVGNNPFLQQFTGLFGPVSWGPGGITNATSFSGDLVVIAGLNPFLYVPSSYVSGAPLVDMATFTNTTILGLGFVPGTYTYTWGSGANADSLTIIGLVVPEPTTWSLVGAGLLILAGVLRARNHRRAVLG
ncbi:hypothetical protein AYO41_02850 [Verrucomicrobia bacterium SCGC AG-212-E04]|nr:hypothetical protein AYO41_02850 [Verrucomicrobia bacterium SCGC AG-212-E04]